MDAEVEKVLGKPERLDLFNMRGLLRAIRLRLLMLDGYATSVDEVQSAADDILGLAAEVRERVHKGDIA